MRNTNFVAYASALVLVLIPLTKSVDADVVLDVSVSTDMVSEFGTLIENTVNGAGLLGGVPDLFDLHEPTLPDNSWVSSDVMGTILFTFDESYLIDTISFWNQNGGGPGFEGTTGIRDVIVEYALPSDGDFQLLEGGPNLFSQVPGSDPQPPEIFVFDPVLATQFRFTVLSNYGDAFTGFAEVHFGTARIPEPSGGILVATMAAVAGFRRKRLGSI